MRTNKLKCPFCGHKAKFGCSEDGGNYIECVNCKASTRLMYPNGINVRPLLAEAWNERTYPKELLHAMRSGLCALLGQKAADDGYTVHDKAIKELEKAERILLKGNR